MTNSNSASFLAVVFWTGVAGLVVSGTLTILNMPLALPYGLWTATGLFVGFALYGAIKGKAEQPTKSYEEVQEAKRTAERMKEEKEEAERKVEKAKEMAEETMNRAEAMVQKDAEQHFKAKKKFDEKRKKREELIKERAEELAEGLAEEIAEEKMEEKRKQLAEEDRLRTQAVTSRVEEKAEKEVKSQREKFEKLLNYVVEDEELREILKQGPITEDRIRVILQTADNPELRKELSSIQEVNGDIDLRIEQKAEELGEQGPEEPEGIMSEPQPEEERSEFADIPTKTEEEKETPETQAPQSETEKVWSQLDETSRDCLRLIAEGVNSSTKLAGRLDVHKNTVKERYPILKEMDLIQTGAAGVGLTEKGRDVVQEMA